MYQYWVAASLLGLWPTFQPGLEVGVPLSDTSSLTLEVVNSLSDEALSHDQQHKVTLTWHRFWGESFYTKLGAGHMDSMYHVFTGPARPDSDRLPLVDSSLILSTAIGNRFEASKESIFVDVDWIAVDVPIVHLEGNPKYPAPIGVSLIRAKLGYRF